MTGGQRILSEVVSAHDGTPVRPEGQGATTISVFDSPSDAVAAAGELQRSLAAHARPDGRMSALRVAIHTGVAEERNGDYAGAVVNRATRLGSITHGGQVVMSQATAELVQERLEPGVDLHYLGVHHLEGFLRPERVHQLVQPGVPDLFPPLRSVEGAGAEPAGRDDVVRGP